MPDIISLEAERDRRTGPDAQFRTTDRAGRPMFCFMADFEHDGATFSIRFWAYDFEDAERRVSSMKAGLVVAGQVYSEIPG
ncbi:hypothetical protein IB276_11700 [Ensifer sp. ENS04]|uniref:hypothetical protein n=1 Tax=Ensifer sp. ENS04 TaxID=2769281 RepID=UPI00177C1B01|nr:hypothetical protein [Ensifer sp. ENS04]MBD9540118.1 hypothetical protein [Ensifer sp. ENS04]